MIISMTSSAKRLILWSIPLLVILKMQSSLLIFAANGFISSAKIRRDKEHPSRVPLVISNGLNIVPSVRTRADGLE